MDRLETELAPTSQKFLVQDFFKFNQLVQLICPKCGKIKNRVEDNYYLSCEVKNQASFTNSLDKMVENEEINGWKCDGCEETVDVNKRTIIGQTPNVLFVHLKRMVFSFETFQVEKVNSYLDIPNSIDLKPYSVKGFAEREGNID